MDRTTRERLSSLRNDNLVLKETNARVENVNRELVATNQSLRTEVEAWKGHYALISLVIMLAARKP